MNAEDENASREIFRNFCCRLSCGIIYIVTVEI